MLDFNNTIALVLPVLFLLVAILTKKDLAVIAGCLSWMGVLVVSAGHEYTIEMMTILALNSILAIIAATYNKVRKCNLSIIVAILALVQSAINLIQMFSSNYIYGTMTAIIEITMLCALVVMDGRKELIHGVVGSFGSFALHRILRSGGHNNNKGGA